MSFDRTPNFTEKLATDSDFRQQVLKEITNDEELKTLTEEDLKAIVGGRMQQVYGSTGGGGGTMFA
jgi:bacteriocin-like protein